MALSSSGVAQRSWGPEHDSVLTIYGVRGETIGLFTAQEVPLACISLSILTYIKAKPTEQPGDSDKVEGVRMLPGSCKDV